MQESRIAAGLLYYPAGIAFTNLLILINWLSVIQAYRYICVVFCMLLLMA